MVKTKVFAAPVPGASLENMLDLLTDPATYVEYHREVQVNEHVRVGPWTPAVPSEPPSSAGASFPAPPLARHVAFLVSFRAPSWFKKAVGTETVKVRDGHTLTWAREAGASASAAAAPPPLTRVAMLCAPRLWMPGGASEITIANVAFDVAPVAGGTTLTATVTAVAADSLKWLPGLRAAFERVMLYQCEHMASTFVEYAQRVARERWGGLTPAVPPAPRPLPEIALPPPLRALRTRQLSLAGEASPSPSGRRRSSVAGAAAAASPRGGGGRRISHSAVAPAPPPPRRITAAASAAETEFHDALDALADAPASPRVAGVSAFGAASPEAAAAPPLTTRSSLKAGGAAELGLRLPRVRTSDKRAAATLRSVGSGAGRPSPGGALARSLRRMACLGGRQE